MFTPLKFQHHYNNLHSFSSQYKTSDVQNDVGSSMLRLTRFNLNHHHHQRHRQTTINRRPNSVLQIIKAVSLASPMADVPEKREDPTPTATAAMEVEGGKEVKAAALQPPTPPEKPEAGDCCGSGCVRCVWDVYYDKLEAYDLLLKEFNSKKDS